MTLWVLSESVAARLRKHRFLCKTVQLWMRDTRMEGLERQCKLTCPSQLAREIFDAVLALYRAHKPVDPLRSVGVRACDLMPDTSARQLSMFEEEQKRQAHMQIEHAMDGIRERYGHFSIMRGCMMLDKQLTDLNPKDDHQNPCIRSNDDVEMLA